MALRRISRALNKRLSSSTAIVGAHPLHNVFSFYSWTLMSSFFSYNNILSYSKELVTLTIPKHSEHHHSRRGTYLQNNTQGIPHITIV